MTLTSKGAKSLPEEVKKRRGTLKESREGHKDRLNMEKLEELKTPTFLKGQARKFHDQLSSLLISNKIITQLDEVAICLVSEAFQSWYDAYKFINSKDPDSKQVRGTTYTNISRDGKQIKKRPEYDIMSDSAKRLFRMLTEFGLTPSARASLFRSAVNNEDNADELINMMKKRQNNNGPD